MKLLINLSLLFLMISCQVKREEIVGYYVLEKNDLREELILNENLTYRRIIYNQKNENKLLEFTGTWIYDNDEIVFKDFFNSFSNVDSYIKYLNSEKKDKRQLNTSLHVNKSIFNEIYIEVTELGQVVAKYKLLPHPLSEE